MPMACQSISRSRPAKCTTIGRFGTAQRIASANDVARGSWIRRGLDQGVCPTEGGMGKHSAKAKSQGPDLLQPVSVSCAKSRRTVLQQDQAMSAGRDPMRQTV